MRTMFLKVEYSKHTVVVVQLLASKSQLLEVKKNFIRMHYVKPQVLKQIDKQ